MSKAKTTEPETTAAPAPAPEKRPHEAWAEAKGMLPQYIGGGPDRLSGRFRARAPKLNPKYWAYAAAVAGEAWIVGTEVTEEKFDAAVAKAQTVTLR